MSRRSSVSSAVVVAVALLTVSIAVGAVPATSTDGMDSETRVVTADTQPRIVEASNTTNYLMPSADPTREGYTTEGIDVGSAVSTSGASLEGDHRSRTFEERYESAGSDSTARLDTARTTVEDAEARIERLDAEQEQLFRAYSNGTLSRAALLNRLVRLDARASESRGTLGRVRERVEADPTTTLPSSLDTRISELRAELVVLPTPVGDRLAASANGRTDPIVTYVGGTDDALVLAAVDDDWYYRQATVRSEYRGPGSTNISEAFQRVTELYPWVYSGGEQFAPTFGPVSAGIGLYRLDATHPQGSLTAFLSGSTTDIFHENQRLDPTTLPVHDTVSGQNASLNVTVTTTTETGPMRVELRDRASGEPLNGTLFVDGERVTTTGSNGTVWTVRPAGAFEMTVVSDGEEVSLGPTAFFR